MALPKSNAPGIANSVDLLIWVCTVCPDLSVRKLRIITVVLSCTLNFCFFTLFCVFQNVFWFYPTNLIFMAQKAWNNLHIISVGNIPVNFLKISWGRQHKNVQFYRVFLN